MKIKTRDEWARERESLLDALVDFAQIMERRPFQNEAGLRGVSAFALYWFVRRMQPTLVFEVGVWRGFSTWIIEQAAPSAEIWCFDPLFFFGGEPQPVYRTPRAKYLREDFSCIDLEGVITDPDKTLAFFDDHHRQLARLEQCQRLGIEHVVFDDNPPEPYSHRTLEDERRDPTRAPLLEALVADYEVFPALWEIDHQHEIHVKEDGLGFPVIPQFQYLYDERKWHSYVTYVRANKLGAPSSGLVAPTTSAGAEVHATIPSQHLLSGLDIHIKLTAA